MDHCSLWITYAALVHLAVAAGGVEMKVPLFNQTLRLGFSPQQMGSELTRNPQVCLHQS